MRYIHIDTINTNSIFNQSSQGNTFNMVPGSVSYSPHDYNIKVKLPTPVIGVQKIYIKSLQTAILFPNVRAGSLLNFITIQLANGTKKTITLSDKIYTSITTLLADLQTAGAVLFPSDNWTFSLDAISGNVKIASSVHSAFTIIDTNLAYMLGFRSAINLNFSGYVIGAYLYNLAIDSYVNLYLSNIQTSFNPNTNGVISSFKVPITSGSYQINYTSQNLNFEEYVYNGAPNQALTEFHIVITDRWGYAIHSRGSSLALTLALE